ncbi:serine hydrolase domain-containing protein [Streptomyces sp. DSM 118878]
MGGWGAGLRGGARRLGALSGVIAVLVTAGSSHVGATAAAGPGDRSRGVMERVDAYADEQRARARIPGMALAVVEDGEVVHRLLRGKDGKGDAVTRRTPFLIGSLSKPVTATAVTHLAEAGSVELDRPVRRYLPWFRPSGPGAASMTVRHLLNQSSGLTERDGLVHADRFDNAAGGVERVARALAQVRTATPPGERHQYSNANYMLLGALVERVTGRPYGAWLRQEILRPLGMDRAIVDDHDAARRHLAPGHRYFFHHPRPFDAPFDSSGVPYGYVGADIDDLSRFALTQLGGGGPAARAVVSPAGLRRMHTGTVPAGTSHRYGFGWRDDTFDDLGERVVWHSGATPGYHGTVALAPDRGLAVVVQHNAYHPLRDEQLNSTAFGALRILLGGEPRPASADPMLATMPAVVAAAVVLVGAALGWSLLRLARPGGATTRGRRRVLVGGAVAVTGPLLLAHLAVLVLPRQATGVDLAQILLFVPDVGRLLVALAVLCGAQALARTVITVRTLRSTPNATRSRTSRTAAP